MNNMKAFVQKIKKTPEKIEFDQVIVIINKFYD